MNTDNFGLSRFPTFSRVSRQIGYSVLIGLYLAFLHLVGYQDLINGEWGEASSRFPTFSRVSRHEVSRLFGQFDLAFLHSVGYQDFIGGVNMTQQISLSYI